MTKFERQSRQPADHDTLTDEVSAEIPDIATEVIDVSDAPPIAPRAPLTQDEVRTILISLMLTMFLAALDQTIVATALPTIGRQFGDVSNLSWVITAYLLASTAVAPVFGTLSDIYGRRVMIIAALSLFIAGSILCALAPNMTVLILARGLQGEIAALQGNAKAAQAHLSAVVTADAFALRERLLLADLLLAEGQAQQAIDLLAPAIPADGVLIRRVLAAMATGDSAMADTDRAELAQRFKLNIDIGLTAHAREETLYFLRIAKDPDMALQRALVNWALQHEIEDAQLLVDAAIFANQPKAAVPVVRWMAEQSVVAPSFHMPDAVTEAAK